MELTFGLGELVLAMGGLIIAFLGIDLLMEYRWSRQAQTMHAKERVKQ